MSTRGNAIAAVPRAAASSVSDFGSDSEASDCSDFGSDSDISEKWNFLEPGTKSGSRGGGLGFL